MRITLSDHFTYQKLLRFTMPSIVMMIVTSVYSIVDGFFVSNCVGKNAFAALNLIFPVLMALSAFGFMVGTGGSALIAKTLGEGKTKEANGIFSMLVAILAVGGAVLAAVFFVFIRPISYAVGATELTIDDCVLYGRILLVSLPLFMLQNSFQSFLATAEKPGFGLKVTVFAGLTNVVLDFLLVYVLSLGLAGAALATALSQAVGAAIPLAYFLRENDTPLRLGRPGFDLRALWRACCNGSSEMVSNLSGSLVGILYNVQLMAIAQEDGVSAYGVLMYVDFIFKAFFFGYSIAVTPVVGYHYGAQNHAELKSLLRKSLITGYDWQVAGAEYVNLAMFFAFATLYPDAQVLLFFFIPVKIKWMAIMDACYFAYIIFFCAASRYWIGVVLPLVALLNFFVFFAPELGRFAKREQTRTKQAAHFHNAVRQTQREQQSQGYRHKCAVCGRTDVTNPELQFRYCSKCAGYHCFCSDHIFNHVHFTDENP